MPERRWRERVARRGAGERRTAAARCSTRTARCSSAAHRGGKVQRGRKVQRGGKVQLERRTAAARCSTRTALAPRTTVAGIVRRAGMMMRSKRRTAAARLSTRTAQHCSCCCHGSSAAPDSEAVKGDDGPPTGHRMHGKSMAATMAARATSSSMSPSIGAADTARGRDSGGHDHKTPIHTVFHQRFNGHLAETPEGARREGRLVTEATPYPSIQATACLYQGSRVLTQDTDLSYECCSARGKSLATKGCDHKTPIHTSCEVFEHSFNRYSLLSASIRAPTRNNNIQARHKHDTRHCKGHDAGQRRTGRVAVVAANGERGADKAGTGGVQG